MHAALEGSRLAAAEARDDMDIAASRPRSCLPIFEVEVIDAEGYAWLYARLYLHEAIKISAYFEIEAWPGKEPRIYIPPALVRVGLTDEGPADD